VDFLTLMRSVVLPYMAANPQAVRLDGRRTGGNRRVAGRFAHAGRTWVVNADTWFDPLMVAYHAALEGTDPFVEGGTDTGKGRCLSLKNALWCEPHKRMYIYSW
jgi:hypothetical protein